ncbi:MAG: two-component sensor histidine kinase [Acidobacteria bacterium]|nr:MAG: two-component sensor histidine kinase [Acidobacteriota bacterium]
MGRLLPHDDDLGWTPYAWLIYIVPFAITPLMEPRFATLGGWSLFLGATALFLVLYFRGYWARGRELMLVATAIAALGVVLWPYSAGAGALFIYAAAALGTLEKTRHAIIGVAAVVLLVTVEAWLLNLPLFSAAWPFVFAIIVGAINIHFSQVGRSNARLRLAHDEIEHLAKLAERERIARDLHDLLGHTLSLVILKSELATKLADRDPERARDEIRDVERIAREALAQVRSAVSGYRAGGFENEVIHARNALATAGVALETEISKIPLPPAHEAVLALALREAITNIVRHAGARRCRVVLHTTSASCRMTISDDGRGGNAPFGSGLTGMSERVSVLGGTLARDGRSGTTLIVTLPMGSTHVQEQTA